MPKYQALFDVTLNVSVVVEANDAEDASNKFDSMDMGSLMNHSIHNEELEWDSTLKPIKEKPDKKS